MYSTKSEPLGKLWALSDYNVSVVTSIALWRGMLIMEEAMHMWRHGVNGKSLYLPLNSAESLIVLLKKVLINIFNKLYMET